MNNVRKGACMKKILFLTILSIICSGCKNEVKISPDVQKLPFDRLTLNEKKDYYKINCEREYADELTKKACKMCEEKYAHNVDIVAACKKEVEKNPHFFDSDPGGGSTKGSDKAP